MLSRVSAAGSGRNAPILVSRPGSIQLDRYSLPQAGQQFSDGSPIVNQTT